MTEYKTIAPSLSNSYPEKSMKIAQLTSNVHAVAPTAYNAVYSTMATLGNELIDRGHNVDLYAAGDSQTKANLLSVYDHSLKDEPLSEDQKKYYLHLLVSKCFANAKKYDIIHSHFNILSLFYSNIVDTPTVNSIHSPITEEMKPFMLQIKNGKFISFSLAQRKSFPELNWVGNIYHGIDTDLFAYNDKPGDYVLSIGRITPDKGVHLAIEAAKAAGVKIIIAGKSYAHETYWSEKIEPHIDGKGVVYIGEADFKTKIEYYRHAKAVLMPVQCEETFGMVIIEAMSCGTPVIGFNRGSVPEIVAHEKTGFVVENIGEMVKAIKNIKKIKRQDVRKRAETLFSVEKMVTGYTKVYQRIIDEHKFKQDKNGNNNK